MKKTILFILLLTVLFSCKENAPVQVDGKAELTVLAMWNNSAIDSIKNYVPLPNAEMILVSEYGTRIEHSDDSGMLNLTNIPSATYQISARRKHPIIPDIIVVGNVVDVDVISGSPASDTIFTNAISASGISINEIYAGGPVNSIYFFYDQYIELYNSSSETKYLDGMQVLRVTSSRAYCSHHSSDVIGVPGGDWNGDGNIFGVTYAFKFPGKPGETKYPFAPNTFKVLAQDAFDHRKAVPVSVDLSRADWEFVSQFDAVDIDNPKVPNLYNISDCKISDFLISVTSDIILLTSGVDSVLSDGIDITTIIDGVEYQSSGTKRITLDSRIDRGWVQSPPKYDGKSMQRREKGVDTNDGTLDWEIIDLPTPGWQ